MSEIGTVQRMRGFGSAFFAAVALLGSTGCKSVVPEPGKITLQQAMKDVGEGINLMYEERAKGPKTGLLPSEVSVAFNISASSSKEGKLYVEAGANIGEVVEIAKAGAEAGAKLQATRGNVVTVKFTNIFFTPEKTLITTKSPDDIEKLLAVLEKAGFKLLVQ